MPTGFLGRYFDKGVKAWAILLLAFKRFLHIDGDQRAAAFAYYAFFSLFPIILLFVTIGSRFVERDRAVHTVIAYIESYVPLGEEMKHSVFDIISGVVKSRGEVGAVASAVLIWGGMGFFSALIQAVTRARGTEIHTWWRMPLKSLLLLTIMASALLLGVSVPVLADVARSWIPPEFGWTSTGYKLLGTALPLLVLFYGLSLFYMVAPKGLTRFSRVWSSALITALLLRLLEFLFFLYLRNFARFNAVYGALGGIMALLMWIYLSGCLVIFGGCLCVAQAEMRHSVKNTSIQGSLP
jgi:Ca2+-transporting ATPase